MSAVILSASVNTRGLEKAIRDVVPETSRSLAEQSVTSMGMILQQAQDWTPFVSIGRMDAELDATAPDVAARYGISLNDKSEFTEGERIVLARTHENSHYNQITGGRWKLTMPSFKSADFHRAYGDAGMARQAFLEWVRNKFESMKAARHSSGHFFQAGYKLARDICVRSPLFKNRFRARSAAAANDNHLNRLDAGPLGKIQMTPPGGTTFQITAENNVGEGGNPVLDASHRRGLLKYLSVAQEAVDKEEQACKTELERRVALQLEKTNRQLA